MRGQRQNLPLRSDGLTRRSGSPSAPPRSAWGCGFLIPRVGASQPSRL